MSSNNTVIPLHRQESWQEQLQQAIRTPAALAEALGLSREELGYSNAADKSFPLLVPHAFVERMERGNRQDPLLRQILAAHDEIIEAEGFTPDPVGEVSHYGGQPGVLQKYQARALIIVTGQCAVNCRYCFRRHYPYSDNAQSSQQRLNAIDELLEDRDVQEIILSGGDPLLLQDGQIKAIAERIRTRDRGVTLRLHTRLPVVIPDRVTCDLVDALSRPGLPVVMVLHCNHPNEIDVATAAAITKMRDAGITVLNQSVLLAGVNDDAETLASLSRRLFAAGALPYYIHVLDKVAGATHFALPETRARRLMGELSALLPGYLVPKLAVERTGAASKRQLEPIYPE